MSVTTLWSKVTVEAVDTTPLPNNCQSPAMGLESLSQGPGGASCHNFAQGVGLSFGNLWSCGLQTLPCGPFHPGMSVLAHREMKSALPGLLRFTLSAP